MFNLIHAMRTRIITKASFSGDRILGAILFEQTMDRHIEGRLSADYLWNVKNIVPFLKVDEGLTGEVNDFYADLVAHPNVLRGLALSGGYSRAEANTRLARQHRVVASFSPALTEGLTVQQNDEEFTATLEASISSIFRAC